jgi:hypothetical protein
MAGGMGAIRSSAGYVWSRSSCSHEGKVMLDDVASIIGAIGACITAVGVILVAWWTYRGRERTAKAAEAAEAEVAAEHNTATLVATQAGIYELGRRIDGRMDELLMSARESGHAAGVAEEKANTQ